MSVEKNMNTRIQHKHDIEANWNKAINFIPRIGEIIVYDIDENYNYSRFKIGDGVRTINNLEFSQADLTGYATESYVNAKLGKIDSLVGLNAPAANLLITILRDGAYSTDQSANITALAAELSVIEPEKTLSSISAIYTGGAVEVGTVITDLTGITVIAHYSDGSTESVTDYSLSGEIVKGKNSIVVSYRGMTTTFIVKGISTELVISDIALGVAISHKENLGMYINISSNTLPRATLVPVGQYLKKGKTYKFSLGEASTNYYYGVQIFTASQSDLKFEITDETQYFDSVPTKDIDTGWMKNDYEYTVTDDNQILAVNFKNNDSRTLAENDREVLFANFTIEEV